ncbi:MAG: STAS domain-containing protein [Clostridia bacterium]|nr:STAS domain-containing protein [Clostridia bacterium]
MTIEKKQNGRELTLILSGRLDIKTAPQLEAELKCSVAENELLVVDIADVDYISSAGIRVLISAHKVMHKQGRMVLRNANEEAMDLFEMTNLVEVFNLE